MEVRRNLWAVVCLGLCAWPAWGENVGDKKPEPQWIWLTNAQVQEKVYLRKVFELPENLKSVTIAAACDDNVVLYFNDKKVLEQSGGTNPAKADLADAARAGVNVLAAECTNGGGPAGLLLAVNVELLDGKKFSLVTDTTWHGSSSNPDGWRKSDFDAAGWNQVVSVGKWGDAPWGKIELSTDGVVVEATPGSELVTLPDFKVERLYSVPKVSQGSWVNMTVDPKGRLVVSDQYGSLYRVVPGANEAETQVEKLNVPIGEAQGLLFAFDSLYLVVNGKAAEGSGLYRLRDQDGDDQFESVELLKKFSSAGEHGPHAVRLGPDGFLYVIAGNFTKIPEGADPLSPHRNWAEDLLLPRNPDGGGHDPHIMAPGGWICKTDRDGKNWEVLSAGFRNHYDIDFNLDGELFTYDSDMEWDTGTPWYRPTRVNHCVSGAEYGWRNGTGKWPAYAIDSVGAVVDIGLGSPTGITFGTGAKFPEKYQRALYLCDWTYGKLYAAHLQPSGATYTADFETFVSGKPLPLTDVVIGADGAMYFTTGGRKTQSGLYRVTYAGKESTAPVQPLVNIAAKKARETRHMLEGLHSGVHPEAVEKAWPYLNSGDRALRYAARVAIEHQDLALWKDKALSETRINAKLQALVALCRAGSEELQIPVIQQLNALPFAQLTEEQLLDALRVYQLAYIRLGGKQPETTASVIAALDPLLPHSSDSVNRELTALLVYLEAPSVIAKGLTLMNQAQTQQDQMYYALVLRNIQDGWTPEQRRAFFGWLNLAEVKYLGGHSFVKFLDRIRRDAVEKMTDDDQQAFKDVIEEKRQVEAVKLTTTRQFVHNWQLGDFPGVIQKAAKGRSFEKGKAAYEAAQCAKCHRFKGSGGDTGPDITGVGNRFDAQYILESFVVPSKVISDQYVNSVIETEDGRIITGRVLTDEPDSITVRTDPFARELTVLKKSEIAHREPSKISEMPQGLINVLTADDVLDLIAYLRSGGDPHDKMFRP